MFKGLSVNNITAEDNNEITFIKTKKASKTPTHIAEKTRPCDGEGCWTGQQSRRSLNSDHFQNCLENPADMHSICLKMNQSNKVKIGVQFGTLED